MCYRQGQGDVNPKKKEEVQGIDNKMNVELDEVHVPAGTNNTTFFINFLSRYK